MDGLHQLQAEAFDRYERDFKNWQSLTPKKGENPDPPPKLTRYFTTDPTLEALLNLLAENPRGFIMVKDELASLVCGFNQYKAGGRGNERQHYLSIFSGSPVLPDRRHGEKVFVKHPFLTLLGGVQKRLIPEVLGSDAFNDGLIYRFLFLVIDDGWYPLSRKSWHEESREMWRRVLIQAKESCDDRVVLLGNEAWECFRNYRDYLYGLMGYLPSRFAGFIPKMTEYALRLAGILHFWHSFPNLPPPAIVPGEIMEKAIRLSSFYLGQARLLLQLYQIRRELRIDQQTLLSLLSEAHSLVDNGAIPTGILSERFNARVPENIRLPNTRKLTALLKELASSADISLTFRPMRWKSTYCRCLIWEQEKIIKLLRLIPPQS